MKIIIFLLVMSLIPLISHSQPQDLLEFYSGKKGSYSSKNDPKAKGLNVSFEYPISWKNEPGIRTNMLHKVTSKNGKGLESCAIGVKNIPIPGDYNLTDKEAESFFLPAELPSLIPNEAKFISGQQTRIDGQPSGMVMYSNESNRAGLSIRTITLNFFVYYEKKIITFGCVMSGALHEPFSIQMSKFEKHKPLFQLMAMSLVIHDKWK